MVSPVGEPNIGAEPEPEHESRGKNEPYSDEMLHRATPREGCTQFGNSTTSRCGVAEREAFTTGNGRDGLLA